MTNFFNDTSVLDQFEIDTLDIGGDPCHITVVLSYDLDADCYTVEEFNGTRSRNVESFDSRDQAATFFAEWVCDIKQQDAEDRADSYSI